VQKEYNDLFNDDNLAQLKEDATKRQVLFDEPGYFYEKENRLDSSEDESFDLDQEEPKVVVEHKLVKEGGNSKIKASVP
jgi:regulator of RNase E activity RraB